ncbi:hypothetical protein N9878_01010 [bacterium]|nr:hypothetical protein [bacterium]
MRQLQEGHILATLLVCCERGLLTDDAKASLNRVEDDYFFYDENKAITKGFKKLVSDRELIDVASLSTASAKQSEFTAQAIQAHIAVVLVHSESNPWLLDTYINRLIYSIKADEVKKTCEKMIVACDVGIASNNDISDFNNALSSHLKAIKQF